MSILVGNKVKFVNENLDGVVKSILKDNLLLIAASDGFEHKVRVNEVVVIHEDNSITYNMDKQSIKDKIKTPSSGKMSSDILTRYTSNTKFQFEKVIEIDLHLEELVEFPMKLDDRLRLYTQMQHVKKCLEAAVNQRYRKLIFIHGVGEGVLKSELRNYLAQFENISVKDADYREYGSGATEVIIK
ncbi:MAG: Smr/MutS family protein [Bacteroidetes bacterium]|nr:Smr/MutS family protein [Bacteroidota bacterium]